MVLGEEPFDLGGGDGVDGVVGVDVGEPGEYVVVGEAEGLEAVVQDREALLRILR